MLFDLDDTLIKTLETKIHAIQHTGRKYFGVEIPSDAIRSAWGAPFPELMTMLFPKGANLEEVIAKYTQVRVNFPSPAYPHTVRTLRELAKTNDLGIVTSHTRTYIHSDLAAARIPESLFFHIQTSEDTAHHKPSPRVFDPTIVACRNRGIPLSHMWYIGNSLVDYEAAHNAGMKFVGIHGHTEPKEDFERLGVGTISNIKELLTFDYNG